MNCYETIDLMGDALEARLAGASRSGFAEHLGECPACRNYFDQLQVTVQALAAMPRAQATNSRRSELVAAFRRESKGAK